MSRKMAAWSARLSQERVVKPHVWVWYSPETQYCTRRVPVNARLAHAPAFVGAVNASHEPAGRYSNLEFVGLEA